MNFGTNLLSLRLPM